MSIEDLYIIITFIAFTLILRISIENREIKSRLTELDYLKNKIVSVQPERLNELNGMVKTMKMKNIFKK